ncbi:Mu transposase C-terminal domain-containing protein [Maricaulis sp.]|jgi:transposase InsO family protein|uniref:Mu transposase C-terminal domain-containing protein n=1 Tax=Maricaulis sp. TaxID=1486257 RepID=UPI0026397C7E|nr:Mu transposase C-terminal domain-containing protein [Maricaulis sp.]MDF1769105.1 Mu transposase C-terminal domain-containing protein [Maricaulis sp.]
MTSSHLKSVEVPHGNLYPRLRLVVGDSVWINGEEHFVQKRQRDKWILIHLETQELLIETDLRLVDLYGSGKLKYRSRSSMCPPLSPMAPHLEDPHARAAAALKHDYVKYVMQHPTGFRTSRKWLKDRIAEKALERGEETSPSPTSVLNWKRLHDAHFQEIGLAAYAPRHDLKGKRGSRLPEAKKVALDRAVDRYLQGGSIKDAHLEALSYISDVNRSAEGKKYSESAPLKHLDEKGLLTPPSLSTLEREIRRKVSPFVKQAGRIGTYYARKNCQSYQTRGLPDRPYGEVEVDFTPVDLILVDDNRVILGRPYLIAFLDRATRMVVGFSISFDVPGYASVLDGLRNAIFQKRIDHIDGLNDEDWPCMGRIENLYIDNGREFANGHLLAAAADLGFNLIRLPPREPWHKGLVERFMREVARFSHRFPGTTHSNAVQHRDYEEPEAPVLTLSEFRDLATKWIVTDYNRRPNRGLGRAPGVPRAPIDAWRDKLDLLDSPSLPSEELFIALAGQTAERTVQKYGVEWDHIRYWSPDLDRILAHPDHRGQSSKACSAKYHVRRDPYDVSKVYLYNHHAKEVIELPVVDKWRKYTKGLSVFQHRLCREHELMREEHRSDPEALWKARAALINAGMGALRSGRRKQLERKLTRYLYGNRAHPGVSELVFEDQCGGEADLIPLTAVHEEPVLVTSDPTTGLESPSTGETQISKIEINSAAGSDDMDEILMLAAQVNSGSRSDA